MLKLLQFFLLAIPLSVPIFTVNAQTVYQSTSADGSVVFSDHPPADGKVDVVQTFNDLPSSPLPPLPAANHVQASRTLSAPPPTRSRSDAGLVLYTASWCGYCKRAKAYLYARNIAYQEVDVERQNGRSEMLRAGGQGGVPLLVSGNRHMRGFTEKGYDIFFAQR